MAPYKSSTVGRLMNAMRKTHAGHPKVLKPCPKCGAVLGTVERRMRCPEHGGAGPKALAEAASIKSKTKSKKRKT